MLRSWSPRLGEKYSELEKVTLTWPQWLAPVKAAKASIHSARYGHDTAVTGPWLPFELHELSKQEF